MARERLGALLLALGPVAAAGQGFRIAPAIQPEIRAGVVVAREPAALAGVGLNVPASYYVRLASSLDAGRVARPGGEGVLRTELAVRFMSDPFHQSRWGAYGGGGIAATWRDDARGQAALLLVAGLDFPGRSGWRPALELAGGAGLRLGLSLKPVRRNGR